MLISRDVCVRELFSSISSRCCCQTLLPSHSPKAPIFEFAGPPDELTRSNEHDLDDCQNSIRSFGIVRSLEPIWRTQPRARSGKRSIPVHLVGQGCDGTLPIVILRRARHLAADFVE